MADTVDVKKVYEGLRNVVYRLTNESDGTVEAAVTKIDKSTLTGPNGAEPSGLSLLEANWNVPDGYVVLEWDHTTNDEMLVCSGNNSVSFEGYGGHHDPDSTGGTGDIVLTTDGFVDGSSYDITLAFKKKD